MKKIIFVVVASFLLLVCSCADSHEGVLVPLDGATELSGGILYDITEEEFLCQKPDIGEPVTDENIVIDGIPVTYYFEKIDKGKNYIIDYMYTFHEGNLYALKTGYTLKKTGNFTEDEIYLNFQISIDNVMRDLLMKFNPKGEFDGENQRYSPNEDKKPFVMGGWNVDGTVIMVWAVPDTDQNYGRIIVTCGQE